jgi:hypothetical protein
VRIALQKGTHAGSRRRVVIDLDLISGHMRKMYGRDSQLGSVTRFKISCEKSKAPRSVECIKLWRKRLHEFLVDPLRMANIVF